MKRTSFDVIETGIWSIGLVWLAAFPISMLELHGLGAFVGAIAVNLIAIVILGVSGEVAVRSIDQVVTEDEA